MLPRPANPPFLITFALCLAASLQGRLLAQTDSYIQLFDGQTLDGWHGDNPHTTAKAKTAEARNRSLEDQQKAFLQHWRAEDGEFINDGKGPYATSDSEFGDIELLLEYRTVAKADSGIYLRGTPQVQIWDTTLEGGKWDRNANLGSGGLFNNSKGAPGQLPLRLADRTFGEWNQFRILQLGSRTWVELNNKLVVDGAIMENYWNRDLPLPAKGPIHLQTHGGEIRWRNLRVREIDAEEAISRLRGDDQKYGFKKIFNGQDLAGWTGAIQDYEVKDGALMCKTGKGGVLFTEEQYKNFVVRLEFKLPSGGNNGLAIRYPGRGRASYDGMCELQVLDDDHPKYAKLDPRQYHGSVYGIAPAHRGYLRPAGEWNYQQVTVNGSQIQVELNGTIIVDADVSTIHEFKDDAPHPGLRLTEGHFGFAGHNDPVQFRNIAIKKLPDSEPKNRLSNRLIFKATFDDVTDANLSSNDGRLTSASNTNRTETNVEWEKDVLTIAQNSGVSGDALLFQRKPELVYFYPGDEVGYKTEDWSGTVSLWMKLDPNKDLMPGFCDPLQITAKKWNDASLFIDFDKELPRAFRLGVFSDYAFWNPKDRPWDEIQPAERPMIEVANPPFSSKKWTHVCFTWQNINASDGGNAIAKLYLDGECRGTLERPMKFTWKTDEIATMVGINYVGLLDELQIFDRSLSASEVQQLATPPHSAN